MNSGEENISTQGAAQVSQAWISSPDAYKGWPGYFARTPSAGEKETLGLIWRIRDAATFARLQKYGSSSRSRYLQFRYILDAAVIPPRFAFAVSRRVGPAVVRNRIRRRLLSELRRLARTRPELLLSGDYLVRVMPGAVYLNVEELRRDVVNVLTEISRRA